MATSDLGLVSKRIISAFVMILILLVSFLKPAPLSLSEFKTIKFIYNGIFDFIKQINAVSNKK